MYLWGLSIDMYKPRALRLFRKWSSMVMFTWTILPVLTVTRNFCMSLLDKQSSMASTMFRFVNSVHPFCRRGLFSCRSLYGIVLEGIKYDPEGLLVQDHEEITKGVVILLTDL